MDERIYNLGHVIRTQEVLWLRDMMPRRDDEVAELLAEIYGISPQKMDESSQLNTPGRRFEVVKILWDQRDERKPVKKDFLQEAGSSTVYAGVLENASFQGDGVNVARIVLAQPRRGRLRPVLAYEFWDVIGYTIPERDLLQRTAAEIGKDLELDVRPYMGSKEKFKPIE